MGSALVIGYGSIGRRHAAALARAGFQTFVVSRRPGAAERQFVSVEQALAARPFDIAVICNETSAHRASLAELEACGYVGPALVEKPLWQPDDAPFFSTAINVTVAYVLRFHPVLMQLKRLVSSGRTYCAEVRCASYLPDWRPETDYRQTESAKISAGGGALRDLSHEIDYARWLFGDFVQLTALGGRFSGLEIETDDTFAILAQAADCPSLTISVNYLGRPTERSVTVHGEAGTYRADLIAGTIRLNGETVFTSAPFDRDAAFALQHKEAMQPAPEHIATLADGLKVISYIGAIETASLERKWVII